MEANVAAQVIMISIRLHSLSTGLNHYDICVRAWTVSLWNKYTCAKVDTAATNVLEFLLETMRIKNMSFFPSVDYVRTVGDVDFYCTEYFDFV